MAFVIFSKDAGGSQGKSASSACDPFVKPALVITGQEMQYEPKTNESHVVGQAKAERPSNPSQPAKVSPQILTADRFQVKFVALKSSASNPQNSPDNVESIKAIGNVHFYDKDLEIQAEQCTYYSGSNSQPERIICETKVILTKDNHTLKGERGEANLETGIYKVTAAAPSDKVAAVILPTPDHRF